MIGIGFEAGYYGFKTKVNLNKDDVSQKYKYHLIPVLLEATFWMDLKVRADYVPRIDDAYEYNEYTQGNIGFNKMLNIGGNIGLLYRF